MSAGSKTTGKVRDDETGDQDVRCGGVAGTRGDGVI